MKVFSTDPDEFALLSVGQLAWGVIAIGQAARGFIAIGQVAIGIVALGQGAFGIVAAGMGGAGVLWFAGLGPGGRGYCLRLIPKVEPKAIDPVETPLDRIWSSPSLTGMVRLDVIADPSGAMPLLGHAGQYLPIKLTPAAAASLRAHWRTLGGQVYARLRREGSFFVGSQLVVPGSAPRKKLPMGLTVARLSGLLLLAIAWWVAFGKFVLNG